MSDSNVATDMPQYTVSLNGTTYELNTEARTAIQTRARNEYEGNEQFSCWWKLASPEQYDTDEAWDETIHDAGDPVLVIETTGRMTPWDDLDQLTPDTEQARDSDDPDALDAGNGMQQLDPDALDSPDGDVERTIDRTHFEHTPKEYEDVPSPDGDDTKKIPAAPDEMGEHPMLINWVPDSPEITHRWSAGEAIIPTQSWVEWNVQKYADQPRLGRDEDTAHDHWEVLLEMYDCEQINTNSAQTDTSTDDTYRDTGGTAGGNNWNV